MGSPLPLIEEWDPGTDFASAFAGMHDLDGAVLLESGLPMTGIGRYSFFSAQPFLVLRSRGREVVLEWEGGSREKLDEDPFEVLGKLLKKYRQTPDPSGPPFQGGVAGYFSYDLGRLVEHIPSRADSDLGLDELWLGFY
ncbi:MAG: aminodeoxychorismate synthase, component I, partial [Planctomycetota bacterium]